MQAINEIEKQLPAHVTAAVTSAAGIVSRNLERDYGVAISKAGLRASGLLICDQQAKEVQQYRTKNGLPIDHVALHPSPAHKGFLRDCLVAALTEAYTTASDEQTAKLRRLSPVEEAMLLDKLKGRGASMN